MSPHFTARTLSAWNVIPGVSEIRAWLQREPKKSAGVLVWAAQGGYSALRLKGLEIPAPDMVKGSRLWAPMVNITE